MGFSRLDYWSGLPFSSPGGLPNPGSNPHLLHWQVDLYHWTTREARVLGRPWGMLSASFNMVEAFSQSFSLFLCLSLFLHTHTHTHTQSLSWHKHTGKCFDPVATLFSFSWAQGPLHRLMFIWTYLYVLLLSQWIPYFFYEQLLIPGYNGNILGNTLFFHCCAEELSEILKYFKWWWVSLF